MESDIVQQFRIFEFLSEYTMIRYALLIWALANASPIVSAQCVDRYLAVESDSFVLTKNIYFGENLSENGKLYTLLLDVYEPLVNNPSLRPLVILIHGGSFTGGGKETGEVRWICEDLARHGILAASINYRVESDPLSLISQEKMVKAVIRAVEDTKAAIRFFYKHINEDNVYGIDPAYIFVGGTSAGSITALHTIFMDEFEILKPEYKDWVRDLGIDTVFMHGNSGNPGYADSVAGLINISGAIVDLDYLNNNSDINILNIHNSIDLTIPYQFGFPYLIPTLPIVAGSRPIHFKMLDLGGYSELLTFESINHIPHTDWEGEQLQPQYDEVLTKILRFIGSVIPCDDIPTGTTISEISWLKTYPNPASSSIYIEGYSAYGELRFNLVDMIGNQVLSGLQLRRGRIEIPAHYCLNGLYYLFANDLGSNKLFVSKLIIRQ